MKTGILTALLAASLTTFGLSACGDDDPVLLPGDTGTADDSGTDTPSEDTPTEDTPTEDTPTEDTPTEDTPSGDTPSGDTPSGDTPTEDVPSEDTPSEDAEDANADADASTGDEFVFADDEPEAYTRVDRAGMPAVATVLITSKDDYNAGSPAGDETLAFAAEIITNLAGLHSILDDDLAALGVTPCTVVGDGTGTCVAQGVPLIVPDVLNIDPGAPAGFPNGRGLADPVIDITLAVILVDLSVHAPDLFASLPLNPPANDVAFASEFPFLAPAHE